MYDNNIYGPEFDPPGRAGGMQQTIFNEQHGMGWKKIVCVRERGCGVQIQLAFFCVTCVSLSSYWHLCFHVWSLLQRSGHDFQDPFNPLSCFI